MNILMLSEKGDNISLAYKLANEGHTIELYLKNINVADDIHLSKSIKVISSWRPTLKYIDFVICDGTGFGFRAEDIGALGKPVLCASQGSDL